MCGRMNDKGQNMYNYMQKRVHNMKEVINNPVLDCWIDATCV